MPGLCALGGETTPGDCAPEPEGEPAPDGADGEGACADASAGARLRQAPMQVARKSADVCLLNMMSLPTE